MTPPEVPPEIPPEFASETPPDREDAARAQRQRRVDRLLDAIELIKDDRRPEAQLILRDLIRQDGDSAEAWLWMSVAVETVDMAAVSLENVLRIDPTHIEAAGALYSLRRRELAQARRRARLRVWHEGVTVLFWAVLMTVLFALLYT
jgi:hypothetical protein